MNWSRAARTGLIAILTASAAPSADAQIRHGGVQMRGAPNVHMRAGPHPNINRNVVVAPGHPGYRPGYHPGYRPGYPGWRPGAPVVINGWRRPGWGWAPGGAIAAGAAIGFATAAVAASWAPAPPAPGLCWYYTDPSRTQGFWDACP